MLFSMTSFFHFMGLFLFLFLAALTSAVAIDVRDMSIDEYINFVNPPALHKYQNKLGDSVLCVKFGDQISVKYAHDDITRGLEKLPKLKSSRLNISNGNENVTKLGVESECPEETVAMREIKREDVKRAGSVSQFLNWRGRRNNTIPSNDKPTNPTQGGAHEYAYLEFNSHDDPVISISASLNTWNPYVAPDGYFSLSQIWVINLAQDKNVVNQEAIHVGWMVNPGRYGDSKPRLFVYWTNKSYSNGCFDLDCPGFVSVPGKISPGAHVLPVSVQKGTQYETYVTLEQQVREKIGRAWVLLIDNQIIGYWPASLFSALGNGAVAVDIGGGVAYSPTPSGTRLTRTQMGSGRFPERGYGRAAYTSDIQLIARSGAVVNRPQQTYASKRKCYRAIYLEIESTLFFGGTGGQNPKCVAY